MESCLGNESVTHIAKFDIINKKPVYAIVEWKSDDIDMFNIQVFDENNSWTGRLSNESAAKRRERLDESSEEYRSNVQDSLSGNSKNYVYDFTISDNVNTATFVWKKRYEGAVKVHGSVSLQLDKDPSSKDMLIDILLEKNKKLISDIEHVNQENSEVKHDLEQYVQKLEEIIESKTSLESALYGRFVQILNEKKKRIQQLEEHIKQNIAIE